MISTATRLVASIAFGLGGLMNTATAGSLACGQWPEWDSFAATFVESSGRVIDPTSAQTTSEGQSYGLLFSLIGNDQPHFEKMLRWAENNLSQGDLTAHLPAWRWGKRTDGSYGVLDANSATDGDLWIAYALIEAGRLWHRPQYTALGTVLASRILREESISLQGFGTVLLPAPIGFKAADGTVRLNPSYLPLQVLRRLANTATGEAKKDWFQQVDRSRAVILASAPHGFVPDWIAYQTTTGFSADKDSAAVGSFDAIRTYLWVGMLAVDDPARRELMQAVRPMLNLVERNGAPPLRVDTRNARTDAIGDAGFSAALLPLLKIAKRNEAVRLQRARITARAPLSHKDNYYEQALTLFGLGWSDGRYQFDRNGALKVRWTCSDH